MDIGKTIDNYKFYEGYEGEPEVELSAPDTTMEILHIWDGFFTNMFKNPPLDGKGWRGFTRDYNQCEGAFSNQSEAVITNLQEYIDDLKYYQNATFSYEETKEVYNLIYTWLTNALKKGCKEIKIRVI